MMPFVVVTFCPLLQPALFSNCWCSTASHRHLNCRRQSVLQASQHHWACWTAWKPVLPRETSQVLASLALQSKTSRAPCCSHESCSLAENTAVWDGGEKLISDTNINRIVLFSGALFLLILSKRCFLGFHWQGIRNKLHPLVQYSSKWLCLVHVFKWFPPQVSSIETPFHS